MDWKGVHVERKDGKQILGSCVPVGDMIPGYAAVVLHRYVEFRSRWRTYK